MTQLLATLRDLPQILRGIPERRNFRFSMFGAGVPQGALTEISGAPGSGKTEAVLRLLAEHPRERVAWIEERFSSYPVAFEQMGAGLQRLLFVDVEGLPVHPLSIAMTVLSSQVFGIVVLDLRLESSLQLRRLQLAAERSGAAVILLAEKPTLEERWPIALQLESRRQTSEASGGRCELRVLKQRGTDGSFEEGGLDGKEELG